MKLKNKILSLGVFENNKFLDKYCDLIESNIDTEKNINATDNHHIIPKAYFAFANLPIDHSGEKLIRLTYAHHVIAHYYLPLFTADNVLREKMIYAFMMMTHTRSLPESERDLLQNLSMYNLLRSEWLNNLKLKMKGNHLAKGNVLSQETRKQMSTSRTGHKTSEYTKAKISAAHQGHIWIHKDDIYKHVNGQALSSYLSSGWEIGGKSVSEKQKLAISAKNKGTKRNDECRMKMSMAAKGRQPWNKGIPQSDITKAKNSATHKNRVHINNGIQGKMILPEEIQLYLNNGWIKGRLKKSVKNNEQQKQFTNKE